MPMQEYIKIFEELGEAVSKTLDEQMREELIKQFEDQLHQFGLKSSFDDD